MGLILVVGDRNAGKTGVVHARVRAAVADGMGAAMLLPSQPERERAAREIGSAIPVGASVLTLDAFLDELWERVGDGRRIVRQTERLVCAEEAIELSRAFWEGRVPESAMRRIMPRIVQRAGERYLDGDAPQIRTGPGAVTAAILGAIKAYEETVARHGLIERSAAHADAIRRPIRDLLPDVIGINRFETFTPVQLRFVERAAEIGCEVVVALTFVEGSAVTRHAQPIVERLRRAPGAEVRCVEAQNPYGTAEELAALQAYLVAPEPRPSASASGRLETLEAAGARDEADAVTTTIQNLVVSGIAPAEIAVTARSLEERARMIGRSLDVAGIPWRYEGTWGIRHIAFGRAALALLRLVAGGSIPDLAALLQSGYTGISSEEADALLRSLRTRRKAAGEEVWREALGAPGRAGEILRSAQFLRDRALREDALERLRGVADAMLATRHGKAPVLGREGRLDAAARQALLDAAEAVLHTRKRLDPRVMLDVLAQTTVTAHEPSSGLVIAPPERIRSRRFDAVIVLGLNEGELPRTERGVGLSDQVLGELAAAGIDARARAGIDAERLLFYQIVTAARQRAVLSWRRPEWSAGGRIRSLFVDEILAAYVDPGAVPRRASCASDAIRRRAGAGKASWASAASRGEAAGADRLPDDVVEEMGSRTLFSASELESYLSCPRRWFYERHIAPRAIDVEVDPRMRGRLAHDILKAFYERWREAGHARVTEALLDEALAVHGEVAREACGRAPQPATIEERGAAEGAIIASRRVVVRDARMPDGYTPLEHEATFGSGERPPLPFDGWALNGRIDRIDVGDQGLIVMDYKWSNDLKGHKKWSAAGLLQLPLYALAAEAHHGMPVAVMLYRTMAHGKDRGAYTEAVDSPLFAREDECNSEEMRAVIEDAVVRATEAVSGIRSGRIPARPLDPHGCRHCAAHTWCERGEI